MTDIARERIDALLHQEDSYGCPNYLSQDYIRKEQVPQRPTPLRIIEECAKLVTDLSFEPPQRRVMSPSSCIHTSDSLVVASSASLSSSEDSKFLTQDVRHLKSHLATWRRQMCAWAYQSVDTFGLDRELVAVAFDMLDRYLSKEIKTDCTDDVITREDFQLFSMTCLYMAVKVLEPTRKLSIASLIDMSRGYYCAEDISETESDILDVLEWRINGPTPLAFVYELALPMTVTRDLLEKCRDLTEKAVTDEFFVSYKSSTIAVAVLLVASRQGHRSTDDDDDEIKTRVLEWFEADMDTVERLCTHLTR